MKVYKISFFFSQKTSNSFLIYNITLLMYHKIRFFYEKRRLCQPLNVVYYQNLSLERFCCYEKGFMFQNHYISCVYFKGKKNMKRQTI